MVMPLQPRIRIFAIALLLTLPAVGSAFSATPADIGIVVLHGKQGMSGDRPTAPFQAALRGAGYTVQAPTMCWSRTRMYDATFPDCLREIDTAIAALRASGARRIVLAGMSLGGNAAIVYGAHHAELAGVIALAPAGQPEQMSHNPGVAQSLALARQMVAAGQGAQRTTFNHTNSGQSFTVSATPEVYLSFFDPGGPADFAMMLPRSHEPLIWVAGSLDRSRATAAALFARIPANRLNEFVQVTTDHLDTPAAASNAVLAWPQALPAK
jgi:dienelactone hydrolase